MFTTIYRHCDHRKKYHAKEKSNQYLLQYIPIDFFHSAAKEMNIDERFCEE